MNHDVSAPSVALNKQGFLLLGNLRSAIQSAVGYPLLAIQMIAHVPEIAMHAPAIDGLRK
jgi:hypothetical protein